MGPWRLRLYSVGLGGVVWATMTGTANCQAPNVAQGAIAQPSSSSEEPLAAGQCVFAPADRMTLLRLSDAQQLLQQSRYAEAVRLLGSILENPEDYFFQPDPTSAVHRSLKAEAQRLLGVIPRQGRELYELQYGARARQMLNAAVKAGNASGLAEVARRMFHTKAGCEATFLLGLHNLDRGSPLAAALTLRRLKEIPADSDRFEPTLSLALATCWIRAGMPEKAGLVLRELRERHPQVKVQVAGTELSIFDEQADGLDRLVAVVGPQQAGGSGKTEQWAMFRGNPARNATSTGSGPLLSMRWQVPTYEQPFVKTLIDQSDQLNRQREPGSEALPSLHPLVVNDVVLMRNVRTLLAVDLATGKRIWEASADDPLSSVAKIASDSGSGELRTTGDRVGQQAQDLEVHIGLQLRLWADTTYGTLSSDGQLVFAIEDLDLATGDLTPRRTINGLDADAPVSPRSYNRLAAYDIRTGKLKWHAGGSPTELHLAEAGMFFLGPPLPLMGELYILGESKGETHLLALNARSGTVLWTQQLAVVERDVRTDPMRRLTGASPSYADGILICPTGNRAVVAMDLATRSLLWGYTYNEDSPADQRQLMAFGGFRSLINAEPAGRWKDATATVADGHVLVTPPDSSQIYCLSLLDGRLLWSQPRQDDLYLACVAHAKVILVGRNRVRALLLDDGQPTWSGRIATLPGDSSPSGRGFLSGDLYYVPLSTAEVVAVAVDTGSITQCSKARDGTVPGNMVCYKGQIISQRADSVAAFYQQDALHGEIDRRLAANPHDAEALALRGQILWDAGRLQQAVQSLRQSWDLTHDSRTRELLRDALFEGLRTDFAAYRQYEDEVLRLIDRPQQQAMYLRLMVKGCEAAQQFDAALDYELKLVDLDREHRDLEVIDKSLIVRRDRWLQVQLANLRRQAPPAVREKLDRISRERLEQAVKAASADALRQYLDYFGSLPTAPEARRHLRDRLKLEGRLLEAELLLTQQQRSADPQTAATATAELAQFLRDADRAQDAAVCYEQLGTIFADVICGKGKTGRDFVASLPPDDSVRRLLLPAPVWPLGKIQVDVDNRPTGTPQSAYARAVLEYHGSPSPFFSDIDIEVHQVSGGLVARDGLGRQLWELSGSDLSEQVHFMVSSAFMRLVTQGHLLLVTMGQKIVAIDTLSAKNSGSPRILWSRNLGDDGAREVAVPISIRAPMAPGFGGRQHLQIARAPDSSLGVPAVVSEHAFCYQRFHDLLAIDPTTGATLWTLHGVEPGSTIFGDQQNILITAPGQDTATVLRAIDGSLVGTRPLPVHRVATFGRYALVVQDLVDARVLQLLDPLDSSHVWPEKRFAPHSQFCLVDNKAVGALEPNGHFVLARLADGRALVDAKLKADPSVDEIHVLQSPDGYTLITNGGVQEDDPTLRRYPLQPPSSVRIGRGRVWGFSRTGELLWPEPVLIKNQQLPLNQPRRLPVLLFACMTQQRRPNVSIRAKTLLVFVDKRTGWKYDKELPYATNTFQLTAAPDTKTVQMQLQHNSVTLTFTDQPLGPRQPEDVSGSGASSTAKALWNALGKGVWKALREPLESPLPLDVALEAEKAFERAAEKGEQPMPSEED